MRVIQTGASEPKDQGLHRKRSRDMRRPIVERSVLILATFLLGAWAPPLQAQHEMYAARRQALMESVGEGVVVLFSDVASSSFNKAFYYLTGIKDPGAALVLTPGAEVDEVLFNDTGDWLHASGNSSAEVYQRRDLPRRLPALSRERQTAHVSFSGIGPLQEVGRSLSLFSTLKNVDGAIAEMRILKDDFEIEFLRQACQVTAEGLNDVFRAAEIGMQEKDLADIMEAGFKNRGSPGYSFLQAASGPNATNVHFGATERVLEDGDIIVFDVGAWWNDYTADISRTIPANGEFSMEQREIYTVVLNSQKAAIDAMRPGASMDEVREIAQNVLIDGLHELGLVLDPEDPLQRAFFIAHGYYHFIGLDIHDVWSEFGRMPGDKVYQPGMIMTMEPGLYFPANRMEQLLTRLGTSEEEEAMRRFLETIRPVYEKYVNIGVRIEDDVLITEDGNEVLTAAVPKEIDDIEAMMKG
jgi:Xaa-Pro aminopeptidase